MNKGYAVGIALVAASTLIMGVAYGAEGTYACSCSDHAGEWTGTYSSQAAADASLKVYCRDDNHDGVYGTCKLVG